MDHHKIDHLVNGDHPAVEVRIQLDGILASVGFQVIDPATLPTPPSAFQGNETLLSEACSRAIHSIIQLAYSQSRELHLQFCKALFEDAKTDRDSYLKQQEMQRYWDIQLLNLMHGLELDPKLGYTKAEPNAKFSGPRHPETRKIELAQRRGSAGMNC